MAEIFESVESLNETNQADENVVWVGRGENDKTYKRPVIVPLDVSDDEGGVQLPKEEKAGEWMDMEYFRKRSFFDKMRYSCKSNPRGFVGYTALACISIVCFIVVAFWVIYAATTYPSGADSHGLYEYMEGFVEKGLHEKWARELQTVADTLGEGSRSAFGNPLGDRQIYKSKKGGFDASVDWLKNKLAEHAPSAAVRSFDTPVRFVRQDKPTIVAPVQVATALSVREEGKKSRPKAKEFEEWLDYILMRGFEGKVDKSLVPLIYLREERFCNLSSLEPETVAQIGRWSGCGFVILRGDCTFHQKLQNVLEVFPGTQVLFIYDAEQELTVDSYAAPLEGSLYVSQENPDELNPNMHPRETSAVPVFGVSNRFMDYYCLLLAQTGDESLYIQLYVEAYSNVTTSQDTCASFKPDPRLLNETHRDYKKLICGAHIDSVNAGPGMNDNGSGTLAILAVAYLMHKTFFENAPQENLEVEVELCWWASEEEGLFGSRRYASEELDTDFKREQVLAYLNLDMIASPNHVYGVMDPDDEASMKIVPAALMETRALRDSLRDSLKQEGVAWTNVEVDARSDHAPFAEKGIPVGGLFTGAEKRKTLEQRHIWGGLAGASYDPCYHSACDTFDNLNLQAWEKNMRAFVRTLEKLIE